LDAVNANWEVTRYSGVVHGFTAWEYGDAYSLRADTRSWDSMLTALAELRKMPLRVDGEEGDDSGTGDDESGPSAPMPVRSPTASESTHLKANLFGVAGVVSLLVSLSLLMS
jgi:hypothetical protein